MGMFGDLLFALVETRHVFGAGIEVRRNLWLNRTSSPRLIARNRRGSRRRARRPAASENGRPRPGAPKRAASFGVINMAIGAAQAGVRSMCATSGGGFALMSEGLGMSAMIETPVVVINCPRAGPSTGVPTKTEQGDLWQMLGAAFGDYPRAIVAPLDIADCFKVIPEMFNLVDRFQCPGLVLCDLLLSEGRLGVDTKDLDFSPAINRGELILSLDGNGANGNGASAAVATNGGYKRYKFTESGISPRAVPGVPGHIHTVATDEHMEDGVLISDEFTNPIKRRAMMEKRMRKVAGIEAAVAPPELRGPRDAEVTLIGWGSTKGVIEEACEILNEEGISANQLQVRWLVPLHGEAIFG